MRKKDLSNVIIIITTITIITLLIIKYFIINNYINGFKDIEPINNKEEVENIDNFEISEKSIVYRNDINEFKQEFNENKNEEKILKDLESNENKILDNKSNINNDIDNKKENIEESINDKEKSVQVFKTDKSKLISEISFRDKLAVLSIVKNLSSNEYKELLNNIKRNDELNAAVDIFTILKDNLSKEDYEELKDIAEPYLNIEAIEKNIK